ncbi:hypothetical protein V6N12_007569 [Hibiscus sabdariffa]|uniref:DUF4283 domain-containing protein n=1 Tax=Hibiscus sabdariffa TaxID=183260 RepID=A0ABR2F254_9ROSI
MLMVDLIAATIDRRKGSLDQGGRANADFPVLSTQPSLERPASLVEAEEQRATKKVKNKGVEDGIVLGGSHSTEAHISDLTGNVDEPMQEEDRVATNTLLVDGIEDSHVVPNSYAAVVAGSVAPKTPAKITLNPDDIVVLDEDVRVDDSGPYTTISFSDRVHDAIDQNFPILVLVWVRLPGLPYRYYTEAVFRRIVAVLGRIVRVDYNTVAGDRGKFARLAVMVDLNKPLRPCLGIDGFLQHLEYEGLHNGLYGHSRDMCGHLGEENKTTSVQENHSFPFSGSERHEVSAEELYGPWMLVSDRRCRPRRMNGVGKVTDSNVGKSRFDVLTTDDPEVLVTSSAALLDATVGLRNDVPPSNTAETSLVGGRKGTKK